MNDQISRQKLIEDITSGKYTTGNIFKDMELQQFIKDQPPADQWIPCSERLPKKPQKWVDSYIVQQRHVYTPFSAYWDGKKWTDEYAEELNNVLAWMPLPEPYKGVE